jgi:hypothetical protein
MTRHAWVVIVLLLAGSAAAAERKVPRRVQKELDAIQMCIEQNLRASNEKSVKGVVKTMTPNFPNQQQFVAELEKFFNEVDCYTRLVRYDIVNVDSGGQRVIVRIVQETLAGNEGAELPYSDFRAHSAMLPPWQLCEFELEMHKIRGKWLIHEMNSAPVEYIPGEKPACANGLCR